MKGFVAYSKADSDAVDRLLVHLKGLEYEGVIETWYDRQLAPGDEWDAKIHAELSAADVIIFCVSADLLATDYVQRVEIPEAITRHNRGDAAVIPIIFRKCAWEGSALGKLQGIPAKGDTVQDYSQHGDLDEVWTEVTIRVRDAVKSRQKTRDEGGTDAGSREAPPETWVHSSGAKPIILSELGQASDLEQDDFTRSTFSTIRDYFEASLGNLKEANPECETRLRIVSEDAFEASVYVNGRRRALCGVFVQNRPGWAGIGYSTSGVGDRNAYNDCLSLAHGERGTRLKWKDLLGMHRPTGIDTSEMDPTEASRHLWLLFVQHL